MKLYTEAELIAFGNYLLSKQRKKMFKQLSNINLKDRLSEVHDADVANWKDNYQLNYSLELPSLS